MAKQNKSTHDEHYIPQFYIRLFYADKTDKNLNAEQGKVCYRRFDNDKIVNCLSDKICHVKDLYETAMNSSKVRDILIQEGKVDEAADNFFEKELKIKEDAASVMLPKIINRCKKAQNGEKVLNNADVEFFTEYLVLQLFRHPVWLEIAILSYYTAICLANKTQYKVDSDIATLFGHETMKRFFTRDSQFIKEYAAEILKTHNVCIVESTKDFSFFVGDFPILIPRLPEPPENIFKECTFIFPVSPKYCVCFTTKKQKYHKKKLPASRELIELYIETFVDSALVISNFIFSDKISNELFAYLKERKDEIILLQKESGYDTTKEYCEAIREYIAKINGMT